MAPAGRCAEVHPPVSAPGELTIDIKIVVRTLLCRYRLGPQRNRSPMDAFRYPRDTQTMIDGRRSSFERLIGITKSAR
jgi:hypothetical protein